jgi:hypothetical protein
MNPMRLALAAAAATAADAVYGFLVYGTALASAFAAFPAVFRTGEDGAAYLPVMFACIFGGMLAVVYLYARGYQGGRGAVEGLRFGLLLAIFNAGYISGTDYGILNISGRLALTMALAGAGEWLLVGVTIGLVYKPARV